LISEQLSFKATEGCDLFDLLQYTALFLWKDWPRDMEVVCLGNKNFTFRGTCPHCSHSSVFMQITNVAEKPSGYENILHWIVAMQCQGCLKYILGIVFYAEYGGSVNYGGHFPLGKPDETVADEIPDHIKPDFKEALRCRFVNAYNATVEMCRRALEASCIDLGASPKDVLEDMIDELEAQRQITPFLKEVAHKIRLGGNRGAHPTPPVAAPASPTALVKAVPANPAAAPAPGPVRNILEEHADAVIKFTHEFFHHVYVVPKQMAKYDFSKLKI
jgi:hypothetical protein